MIDGAYAQLKAGVTAQTAFVTPLQEAEKLTADVVERLALVTEQLCGATPPAESASALRGVPNGLFDAAAQHGHNISDMLGKAHQCLSRIERALP